MTDSFFVVGPTLVLRGDHRPGATDLALTADRAGNLLGRLTCGVRDGVAAVRWRPAGPSVDRDTTVEALRLFVRVVVKRFRGHVCALRLSRNAFDAQTARALAVDGFGRGAYNDLLSTTLAYERAQDSRVADVGDVYADPYTVPWNFVPVEFDVLDRLRERVDPPGPVLEFGCGFGKGTQALVDRGYVVHGLDISAAAVERARRLALSGCELAVASAERVPWPPHRYAAVLDIGCLHCMPADRRPMALREAARMLRTDGWFLSRMFRPRPAEWLRAQPFRTEGFGLEPDAARDLVATAFGHVTVDATADLTYLAATEPRP